MNWRIPVLLVSLLTTLVAPSSKVSAQIVADLSAANPQAVVDLTTPAGTRLVKGQWRYRDARIVPVNFRRPGADRKASGAPDRAYDITPQAGVANFDDSTWETIAPDTLDQCRCTGKLCFNWYRLNLTIPPKVGNLDPTGADLVWVNGKLPLVLGQVGGAAIAGYNAPNRVLIARNVKPGQQFQLAVFGANGPLSQPPGNFIWIRSATLDFYKPSIGKIQENAGGKIVRLDRSLDEIVPPTAKIEKLASGFQFTEGPVWVKDGGYLLFSDPNANKIYRWSPDGRVSIFRTKSGYTGVDIGEYKQPGSNGLTIDKHCTFAHFRVGSGIYVLPGLRCS